jgi:XTP/dITP diphosphohydrolase
VVKTAFQLLIATRNEGKVAELQEAFGTLPVTLRFLREFENISEAHEVGNSYIENATLKAMNYARKTGITALADDSGLEVAALHGRPGVLSARFGGIHLTDTERTRALLSSLDQIAATSRNARFVCCMVLYGAWPSQQSALSVSKVLAVTQGVCEGSLANEATGTDGFGFDPIFIPNGHTKPFAALDQAIKARISHRARAAESMRQQLELFLGPNLTAGRSAS